MTSATWARLAASLLVLLLVAGCGSTSAQTAAPGSAGPDSTDATAAAAEPSVAPPTPAASATPEASATLADEAEAVERPEWFGMEMTDVLTGESFTINDFAGKVVLLETMAIWCPTCRRQADEVARLHDLLGDPDDLVSVSLDVDMGEDDAMLKDYVQTLGYDWPFAVAPLLVARALGNLYSAQYLNPPVSPMLIIDREGNVLGLPFGGVKSAEALAQVLEPLLEA
jgi:thiol-disulfide isomerase/thioredoxin